MTGTPGKRVVRERRIATMQTGVAAGAAVLNESTRALADVLTMYDVPDIAAVRDYVEARPHLVPLLARMRPEIARYFGDRTRARLEVLWDPDGGSGSGMLYALVVSQEGIEETMRRSDLLDQNWWIDESLAGEGDLALSVDYS
jgi:hypothetical protein